MTKRCNFGAFLAAISLILSWSASANAETCPPLSAYDKALLVGEHLFGGLPSAGDTHIRRGYVTEYDPSRRVPRWSAWHAIPAYLDTPQRKGRWSQFRSDPDLDHPVRDTDYLGLLESRGYARGHIAPYFISGGDRDGDGQDAEIETVSNLPIEDIDDACTVFEINYMSNIAPQIHDNFNGSGGLWNELETIVRQRLLPAGKGLHLIAGTIFGDAEVERVGPNADIHVPHMFFKIVITNAGVVPFLFVHTAQIGNKGCPLNAPLEACIVSVADIETLSGLDFFDGLPDEDEARLEGTDGSAVWQVLMAPQ